MEYLIAGFGHVLNPVTLIWVAVGVSIGYLLGAHRAALMRVYTDSRPTDVRVCMGKGYSPLTVLKTRANQQ